MHTRSVSIDIATDRCVGCRACSDVCTHEALQPVDGGAWAVRADPDRCSACHRCEPACPFGAIAVTGTPRTRRQLVVDALQQALHESCPEGWYSVSPGPTFRNAPSGSASPDVALVRTDPQPVTWLPRGVPSVPLVVEVRSARRGHEGLAERAALYHRCGVTTFWTVDEKTGAVTVQWSNARSWFDGWARAIFA